MASTLRDKRIVTVEVSRAELVALLAQKAKDAGLIDFDPNNLQVQETDVEACVFNIIFEQG